MRLKILTSTSFETHQKHKIMKQTVLKYGGYAFLCGLILFFIMLQAGKNLDFGTQEVLGYATIIITLSFVFFGIKHYRDHVNHGKVTFGKALVVGLLISVLAGLGIGITDGIYVTFINPDFFQEYSAAMIAAHQSAGELDKVAEVKAQMKDFEGMSQASLGVFSGGLMFITVVLVGLIISVLSAVVLQKK